MISHNLPSCLEWLLQQPSTINGNLAHISDDPVAAHTNAATLPPDNNQGMARLAPQSTNRPRYAVENAGLPTPSASSIHTEPRHISPAKKPAHVQTPAATRPRQADTPMTDYGDDIFDIDDIEQLDCNLNENLTTSSFGDFGDPEKLWTHVAAARVEPSPKRGKKRKSDEFAEDLRQTPQSPVKQLNSSSDLQSFKDAPTFCEESPCSTQIKVSSTVVLPRSPVRPFKRSSSHLSSPGKGPATTVNSSNRRMPKAPKHVVADSEDEDKDELESRLIAAAEQEEYDHEPGHEFIPKQDSASMPSTPIKLSPTAKDRSANVYPGIEDADRSQNVVIDPAQQSIGLGPAPTSSAASRTSTGLTGEEKETLDRFLKRPTAHCDTLYARLRSKLEEVAGQITIYVMEHGTTPAELRNARDIISKRMKALEEIGRTRSAYQEKLNIKKQLANEISDLVINGGDYESVGVKVRAMKPEIDALEIRLLAAIRDTGWTEDQTPALPNQAIPRTPARTGYHDPSGVLVNYTQHSNPQERSIPPTQHHSIVIRDESPPVAQTPVRTSTRPQNAHFTAVHENRNVAGAAGPSRTVQYPRSLSPAMPDFDDEFDDDDAAMLDYAEQFEQPGSKSTPTNARRPALAAMSNNVRRAAVVEDERKTPSEEQLKFPWSKDVMTALRKRFHLQGFRHNQLEAINTTLSGHDAFVLMPTGGGKSLCYQLPSIIQSGNTKGVTIVISPLLSLMQDQVNHLQKLKIQAFLLNGECTVEYRDMVLQSLRGPRPEVFVQLLYITPEMLAKSQSIIRCLSDLHKRQKLARIVIDEAHCVSQWGHDFRPDYKNLGETRRQFSGVPVMALTATATENVKLDTMTNLGMRNCKTFTQSFNRPNLSYTVRKKLAKGENLKSIADTINTNHKDQCGIVYCLSRKKCEDTAKVLREQYSIKAAHYHAGMQAEQKGQVQSEWQAGKHHVIVATIAFGMGIDKPNVRFVIHETIPKSLEGYYQETGRAGRDGKPSDCYLYYGYGDTTQLKRMIEDGDGSWEQKERQKHMLRNVVQYCENTIDCRRCQVLAYFNEHFQKEDCNANCDNCQSELVYEMKDFSDHAKSIIGLMQGLTNQQITLLQCVDLYSGKSSKKSREADLEDTPGYGDGAELELGEVERLFYRLVAEDALEEYNKVNGRGFPIQYLKLGSQYQDFLQDRKHVRFPVRVDRARKSKSKPSKTTSTRKKKGAEENRKNLESLPGSTLVSSPAARVRGQRQQKTLPIFADESEGEESDPAFEPVRRAGRARPSREHVAGPAITTDAQTANLSQAHQNIIGDYVRQARSRIQTVMLAKNLRQNPVSDTSLRDMFIRFPKTTDDLNRYEGMNAERMKLFGSMLLKLIREAYDTLQLCREEEGQNQDLAPETIELSDDEAVDCSNSDQEDEQDGSSHYFAARENVAAFNNLMSRTQTLQSALPQRSSDDFSQSRAKGKGKVTQRKRSSTGFKSRTAGTTTRKRRSTPSRQSGGSQSVSGPTARKKTTTSKARGPTASKSMFEMMPT